MARRKFSGFVSSRKKFCGPRMSGAPKGRRWGSLPELDFEIGDPDNPSSSFNKQPLRLRLLKVWRHLHGQASHGRIRRYARKEGVGCSSNIGLRRMLRLARKFSINSR